ncbi:MAG: prepilin-type N-terminal cleavage/methylation domain-containing protein [Candidatus Omnitrophota bacterium]
MRPNPKNIQGVTLVELIMAMVLLGFVALASAAMIGAQIQGMLTSTDFTAAGNIARGEMERLKNIAYASVANGSSVSGPYTASWTVATVAGGGGAERKDITLTARRTGTSDIAVTLYVSIAKDLVYAP